MPATVGAVDFDGRIDAFIERWRKTGGSELANTHSFLNGLCELIGVEAPHGSLSDDSANDYVFERRVFQDNGDGTTARRIDCLKRDGFISKPAGIEGGQCAADKGEDTRPVRPDGTADQARIPRAGVTRTDADYFLLRSDESSCRANLPENRRRYPAVSVVRFLM